LVKFIGDDIKIKQRYLTGWCRINSPSFGVC